MIHRVHGRRVESTARSSGPRGVCCSFLRDERSPLCVHSRVPAERPIVLQMAMVTDGSASPTLACRAIDARWPELLADVERLGDGENETAIVMLVQWVDLATAALAKTPPPTSRRRQSNGRLEPERPAHAAANSLYRHSREATAAIATRMLEAPAHSAAEMQQWQSRTMQMLGQFQAMMTGDHSSQHRQLPQSTSTTARIHMPTKEFSAQQGVPFTAAPAQAVHVTPPVVVHATAVVVEDSYPTAAPAGGCIAKFFRMLTRRPSDPPPQQQRSPSYQQPCDPLSAGQAHGQRSAQVDRHRMPSLYGQTLVQDSLLPLSSAAARG